jgi:hypothetical protein
MTLPRHDGSTAIRTHPADTARARRIRWLCCHSHFLPQLSVYYIYMVNRRLLRKSRFDFYSKTG